MRSYQGSARGQYFPNMLQSMGVALPSFHTTQDFIKIHRVCKGAKGIVDLEAWKLFVCKRYIQFAARHDRVTHWRNHSAALRNNFATCAGRGSPCVISATRSLLQRQQLILFKKRKTWTPSPAAAPHRSSGHLKKKSAPSRLETVSWEQKNWRIYQERRRCIPTSCCHFRKSGTDAS